MIPLIPRYLVLLSSIIIGVNPIRAFPAIAVIAGGIIVVLLLRRAYRERSIALLVIFGLMFVESVFLIAATTHFIMTREPRHLVEGSNNIFDLFRHLDFAFSILGTVAAGCAAVFIEFGKSRISLARSFPKITFLETPAYIKDVVTKLAIAAGVRVPDVHLVDSGVPSAFTVRANRRFSLAVSVGLLESLEDKEVEACLAHEIAHLRNNDFTVRFIATLAKVALFARPLSYLLEPAVYRAREFLADSTAAKLIGGPEALISALFKLKESGELDPVVLSSSCVCNLNAKRGILRVFDKHPTLEDRIKALRNEEK